LFRLALHLTEGLLTVMTLHPFLAHSSRQGLRQRWSRRLLRLLGVELAAHGATLERGSLLVACWWPTTYPGSTSSWSMP